MNKKIIIICCYFKLFSLISNNTIMDLTLTSAYDTALFEFMEANDKFMAADEIAKKAYADYMALDNYENTVEIIDAAYAIYYQAYEIKKKARADLDITKAKFNAIKADTLKEAEAATEQV